MKKTDPGKQHDDKGFALPEDLSKGVKIWIPHNEDGWRSGTIIECSDFEHLIVEDEKSQETLTFSGNSIFIQNPSILEGVDDMVTLSYLHEPAILHNLATRYSLNIIYTYTGSILIAVNPYRSLNIYSKEIIEAYAGQPLGRLSAHVFAIADDAWRSMLLENMNQSILVSGESGAGKTETTKFLLQYFAAMGSREKTKIQLNNPKDFEKQNIEKKVLESTPLLEAFGNAKTLKNDNSSRFGKFIEIQFEQNGIITGAKIRTYLLEKSRIVRQSIGERNYHIFYQLTKGASAEERNLFMLPFAEDADYISQSQCLSIDEVSDEDQFRRTRIAMNTVGILEEEQKLLFFVLSAVLWLGNVKFENGKDVDSCKISDITVLQKVAKLLQCDEKTLEKYLISKYISAANESYFVPLTPSQATSTRDALAMLIYSRLFDWLVKRINVSIQKKHESSFFIGVLDIYGFEFFDNNSFEQFCINYANEKLQQQFNQTVFSLEQKEYEKEKIDWSYIEFNDNQECLDLLEKKPMCVLTILDEECKFPKASAETFAQKLYENFIKKKVHPYFEKPRFSNAQFTIRHYAGQVTYSTDTFLDKNKDYIVPEHISILIESKSKFVKEVFSEVAAQVKASGKKSSYQFVSVGSQFRDSLGSLMDSIHQTTPHYIRCIKPNTLKKPMTFDKNHVLHQLRCGGVMECIRITKAGYPTRKVYEPFVRRYKVLAPKMNTKGKTDPKTQTEIILSTLNIDKSAYQLGLTKLFLKAGLIAKFEKLRIDKLNAAATLIQKRIRGIIQRKKFAKIKKASLVMQAACRAILCKQEAKRLRQIRASIILQKNIRSFHDRSHFLKVRKATVVLQNAIRGVKSRKQLNELRVQNAVTTIQTSIRSKVARDYFNKIRKAVILAQTRWRGKLAKRELTALRIEARSLSKVVAQKNDLEKKLEEITWKFSAEVRLHQRTQDTVQDQENAIKELQEKLEKVSNVDSRNKELSKKLETLNSKMNAETTMNSQLANEITLLKEQLRLEQENSKKTSKLLENANKEIEDLKRRLQTQNESIEASDKQRDALIKENEELKAQKTKDEEEITNLKKELEESKLRSSSSKRLPSPRSMGTPKLKKHILTVSEMEAMRPKETALTKSISSIAGNDSNKGAKLLAKLLTEKSMTDLKEDPLNAFFNGIPIPAFTLLRCYMLEDSQLDNNLLNYLTEYWSELLPTISKDLLSLSYWLSNTSLMVHLIDSGRETIVIDSLNKALKKTDSRRDSAEDKMRNLFIKIYGNFINLLYKRMKVLLIAFLEEAASTRAVPQSEKNIIAFLAEVLNTMITTFLNVRLARAIFEQIFYFINAVLFNEIILRRDLCTWAKGLEIKMKLSSLEQWLRKAENKDWTGDQALKMLEPVRQLVSVLSVDKQMLTNKEIRETICPLINLVQLKQVLSMYQHDELLEDPIPITLIFSIVHLPDYNLEDPLVWDVGTLLSIDSASLHFLEYTDLNIINFPSHLQAELEEMGAPSPQSNRPASPSKEKKRTLFRKN